MSLLLQRKEWLKGALAEVAKGQNSEVEQMKECMRVLLRDGGCERGREGEEEGEDEEGETEGALEFLSELCENLDNARGETCQETGADVNKLHFSL